MNKFLLLLIAIVTFSCSNKIEVSGHREERGRQLSGYHRINVVGNMRLTINKGDDSVVVKTFSSVHDYVKTTVHNGELRVEFDEKLELDNDPNVAVTIFCSAIKELILSGNIEANSSTDSFFDENKVLINFARSSFFSGRMMTKEMIVSQSGGGMKLSGRATSLRMEATGNATIDCAAFYTDFLEIDLGGGSTCDINVNDRINKATISGGSRFMYKGTHIVNNVNVTGGSELISRN